MLLAGPIGTAAISIRTGVNMSRWRSSVELTITGERCFRKISNVWLSERLIETDVALHLASILDLIIADQRHDQTGFTGASGAP